MSAATSATAYDAEASASASSSRRASCSRSASTALRAVAMSLIATARKAVEAEREHDARLDELAEALASASYAVADVAADIAAYATSLDADPGRLSYVQERRSVLGGLTRKYGDTVDEVLAWSQSAAQRLLELEDDDSRLEALRTQESALADELTARGAELRKSRTALADHLGERVTAELTGLAMPHA